MLSEKRMIQEDKPSFRQTAFLFYFCRNSRHARNLLCLSRDAGCCCRFFCFLFLPVSCSRKNRKRVKTLKDEDARVAHRRTSAGVWSRTLDHKRFLPRSSDSKHGCRHHRRWHPRGMKQADPERIWWVQPSVPNSQSPRTGLP